MTNSFYEMVEGLWSIRLDKLEKEVIDAACKAVLDSIGVAIIGFEYDDIARELAEDLAFKYDKGSCVLGGWWKTRRSNAAAINAYLSHALDYDDWLRLGYVHAGSVIIPGLLAYSEKRFSWGQLLENVVFGYEIMARVGAALGSGHYRYWHSTSTAGGVALAITLSRLLGFTIDEAVHAGAVAGYYCAGLWGFNSAGGGVKPFSPFNAVLTAIYSTKLVEHGARTNINLFGSEKGFNRVSDSLDESILVKPPWRWAILKNGYKIYPCCRHTHTAIEAALKIKEELNNRLESVRGIEVYTFKEAIDVANLDKPANVYEARFSLKYLIAISLYYGEVTLDSIIKGLNNPSIFNLMKKVAVKLSPEYSHLYPEEQPTRLVVILDRGDVIEKMVRIPLGDFGKPVPLNKLYHKTFSQIKSRISKKIFTDIYNILCKRLFNHEVELI